MIKLRLLNAQLKIHTNKCKLQKNFQEINDKYKIVFENISESQKNKCLTIITQQYNNNKKWYAFQETHETKQKSILMLRFNSDDNEIIEKLFNDESFLWSFQSTFNMNLEITCIDDSDRLA